MLDKTTYLNLLYDFYQGLLTDKQKNYMELYYHDDLSLGEIAEEFGVSRQAVFENLKRVEQLLKHYEEELQLAAKYEKRQHILQKMTDEIDHEEEPVHSKLLEWITELKNVD